MKFHQLGNLTKHALETWGKHKPTLVKAGISLLEHQSEMNVDEVSRKTGIPRDDLAEIKSMAQRELSLIRELDKIR